MKAGLLGRVSLAALLALSTTAAALGESPAGVPVAAPFELVPNAADAAGPTPSDWIAARPERGLAARPTAKSLRLTTPGSPAIRVGGAARRGRTARLRRRE